MIEFHCAGCGQSFHVDDHLAGRRTRCKRCGAVTRIPTPAPAIAADEPAPASLPSLGPRIAPAPEPPTRRRKPGRKRRKPKAIDRDAWTAVGVGAAMAVLAPAVPLIGFVIEVLKTVIHELGHTATAWALGSPALPSFDLTYGGGVSHIVDRQPILLAVIYGIFAYLAFRDRDDRRALVTVLIAAAMHAVATFTPLRALLISTMGHGTELIIAGIFLYRSLSGNQVLRGEERPLYAFVGLYLILSDARFAYTLMTSPAHRAEYEDAKGGGHWMDFSQIAEQQLHVRLETVAGVFLLACVAAVAAAFLSHHLARRG